MQQKLLYTKQDEVGVLLLGTLETSNDLAEELADEHGGDQYQGITVLQPVDKPQMETLKVARVGGRVACGVCTPPLYAPPVCPVWGSMV